MRPFSGSCWIVCSETTAESVELRVSTTMTLATTSTLSATVAILSAKFSADCSATATRVCVFSVLNPGISTAISYLPGGSPWIANEPPESVTAFRASPVSRFLTDTLAPGKTPPVWSFTVPETVAAVICAIVSRAGMTARTTMKSSAVKYVRGRDTISIITLLPRLAVSQIVRAV